MLSSGGVVQGFVGHDEAFALTLATGIAVIYAGFLAADGVRRPAAVACSPFTTLRDGWISLKAFRANADEVGKEEQGGIPTDVGASTSDLQTRFRNRGRE